MRFSVIIQSYLGNYSGAASNREEKILRAIDSVLNQTFKDFEIVVVADGCDKTYDIISTFYSDNENIECLLIKKQPLWSGNGRNFGVSKANGEYIVYLDIDDYLGVNHLQIINDQINGIDWVWFNDILNTKKGLIERQCFINQKYQNGTSNICYKRSLNVQWGGGGYGLDDWGIVSALHKFHNNNKINTPEYIVCHLPKKLDV